MQAVKEDDLKIVPHHKQLELCTNRPLYRQGRQLRAVKVFTVASESQHLFVYDVPKINLRSELKSLFSKYGTILNIHVVQDHQVEIFTECFHIQYQRIQSARIAKRFLDNKSFYGGILHVCYAPEYETLQETTFKLQQREKDVLTRLAKYNPNETKNDKSHIPQVDMISVTASPNLQKNCNDALDSNLQIYRADDPILSHKKRLNRSTNNTIAYMSQSSHFNGGMNTSTRKLVDFKSLIPFPLRKKITTESLRPKVYGPQLPQNVENETINDPAVE